MLEKDRPCLRRDNSSNIRTALFWAPEGKKARKAKEHQKAHSGEREEKLGWHSSREAQVLIASDRRNWRLLLHGLVCHPWHEEDK